MSGNLDPYLYLNDELCLVCGEGLGNDASTISREGLLKNGVFFRLNQVMNTTNIL